MLCAGIRYGEAAYRCLHVFMVGLSSASTSHHTAMNEHPLILTGQLHFMNVDEISVTAALIIFLMQMEILEKTLLRWTW